MLLDVFAVQENTNKLNKRLARLISNDLIPYILKDRSDYVIVEDAEEMLSRSQSRLIHYSAYEITLSPEAIGYHENDMYYKMRPSGGDLVSKLLGADMAYVDMLEKIQLEIEGNPDITLLANRWTPEMCLSSLVPDNSN